MSVSKLAETSYNTHRNIEVCLSGPFGINICQKGSKTTSHIMLFMKIAKFDEKSPFFFNFIFFSKIEFFSKFLSDFIFTMSTPTYKLMKALIFPKFITYSEAPLLLLQSHLHIIVTPYLQKIAQISTS